MFVFRLVRLKVLQLELAPNTLLVSITTACTCIKPVWDVKKNTATLVLQLVFARVREMHVVLTQEHFKDEQQVDDCMLRIYTDWKAQHHGTVWRSFSWICGGATYCLSCVHAAVEVSAEWELTCVATAVIVFTGCTHGPDNLRGT